MSIFKVVNAWGGAVKVESENILEAIYKAAKLMSGTELYEIVSVELCEISE